MSYQAEKEIIGALLIDPNCISEVYSELESNMFTNKCLATIYVQFQRAYDRGTKVSLAEIERVIRQDFGDEIAGQEISACMSSTYTTSYIKNNAYVVISDYKAYTANKILSTIKVLPNDIKTQIGALQSVVDLLQNGKETTSKSLPEIVKENKDNYFREKEVKPLYLGFDKLDDLLGGLEGGDMIVIGARPAVGKSAFVIQITSNLAKQGKRVGFYNLEMQNKQVYERFVVNESGIGLTRLRRAIKFLGDEKERFDKANEVLEKADNIVITSAGAKSVGEIKAESKHMDYDIIIIDYLQLLKADNTYRGNRTAEVGEISRAIKNLAMELNIPIIALSQLNRVSTLKDDKEPTMSELREAGNIEQDASVIMLMWNIDENDKSKKGCKIEKNRQGECGKIVMRFNGDTMKFEETDESIKEAKEWKSSDKETTPFD